MTYEQLIAHFQDAKAMANALASFRGLRPVSRQQLHYWKTSGVPRSVQCEFQVITGGILVADREDLKQPAPPAAA